MRKIVLVILIACMLFSPLFSINTVSMASVTTAEKNVSISILLIPSCYDDFINWIQTFTVRFTNYTIIIIADNNTFDWFLHNQTRIDQLASVGEVIPGIGYLQTKSPEERVNLLNETLRSWEYHAGYAPNGFFMFQPDTVTINFLKSQNVSYFLGYCFDQYQIDWMSMRGGWQLPYYANSVNALMPENASSGGVVVLPWLTWDWIDSFTVSHNLDTHPVDTNYMSLRNSTEYILNLLKETLNSSFPVGYGAFSFEFDWVKSLNLTDTVSIIIDHIISDESYVKLSCGNFTKWFKTTYNTTPTYSVNFRSPHSYQSIEWFFSIESRVARVNGKVVSYVDYQNQAVDKYMTKAAVLNYSLPKMGNHTIDTSLAFTIDALGGGELRAWPRDSGMVYSGNLADFPRYYRNPPPISSPTNAPTPTPTSTSTPTPALTQTSIPIASPSTNPTSTTSDYSNTQTLTPSPTVPEFPSNIIFALIIIPAIAGALLYKRRQVK